MAKKRRQALRFDAPYNYTPPPMVSPAVGIARVLERRGSSTRSNDTLLDTPDSRLLRSGVVVAHRVRGGLGEWYLSAPRWKPYLPEEQIEPVGATAELPTEFARMVRPIARRAMLGPVAGIERERRSFVLLDSQDSELAEVLDDQVTIRHQGVATARYRETTVHPTDLLTPAHREFILSSMQAVAATAVDSYPTLQQRLGPPATGMTDFPEPGQLSAQASLEEFVSELLAGDLLRLTTVLLEPDDQTRNAALGEVVEDIAEHALALSSWLEAEWLEELTPLVKVSTASDVPARALDISELLSLAAKAPRLGDLGAEVAGRELWAVCKRSGRRTADLCAALDPQATDAQWREALEAARYLGSVSSLAGSVMGRPGRKLAKRVAGLIELLQDCARTSPVIPDVDTLSPAEAFELGRRAQYAAEVTGAARERLLSERDERLSEIRRGIAKLKKFA